MPDEQDLTTIEEANPLEIYRIELESFQGPLDLLLHLIQKNQIDITDIPVAEVTAQYLAYLDIMRDLDLDVASEFLVMASTLIYIKSRMLLPPAEEEGEAEEEDPREDLVRRLIEYQKYKRAAEELGSRPVLERDVFARPAQDLPSVPETYVEATLFQLMDAFSRVLAESERRKPHEVERENFTLEDGIALLAEGLQKAGGDVRFDEFFGQLRTRRRIVTVFLALLELIKRGTVVAVQADYGSPVRLLSSGSVQALALSMTETTDGPGPGQESRGEPVPDPDPRHGSGQGNGTGPEPDPDAGTKSTSGD